jgi:hypothetical protein
VTVSYSQERRKGRSGEQKVGSDIVSQKFSGSVVWAAPIIASFDRGLRNSTPSGSRHPSNLTDEARPSDTSAFRNIPIVDGERVSIKGSLKFNKDFESCGFSGFEICKVTFEVRNLVCVEQTHALHESSAYLTNLWFYATVQRRETSLKVRAN